MAIKLNLPILGQPNPHEAKDVHLVGRYALGVTWADNHSSACGSTTRRARRLIRRTRVLRRRR